MLEQAEETPKALDLNKFESSKLSTTWGYLSAIALCATTFRTIALMSGFFLKPDATLDEYVYDVVPLFSGFLSIQEFLRIFLKEKVRKGKKANGDVFYWKQLFCYNHCDVSLVLWLSLGVERAVQIAYEARKQFPEDNIWISNEIIHNPSQRGALAYSIDSILPRYYCDYCDSYLTHVFVSSLVLSFNTYLLCFTVLCSDIFIFLDKRGLERDSLDHFLESSHSVAWIFKFAMFQPMGDGAK
ncbi:hypothetical protein RHMOL_Rhmol13G0226200 [Rhododendron molle]|uniref:Uncharacterized protein n=1 Tax=Rhododendron molle TaxID=49168 RepID=A0ACC0LAL9_RHOML|nr:hypothetical protein RHMOL_Rhmol13G0226200 [Rhododendron molle]